MKGYYVHHTRSGKDPSAGRTLSKSSKNGFTIKESIKEIETQAKEELPQNTLQENLSLKKRSEKSQSASLENQSPPSLHPASFLTNPVQSFTQLKKHIAASPAAGEALSMLWILAVIILVVYIAGLLLDNFGAGWIIHLLLVAALVIFLLWLLRIL